MIPKCYYLLSTNFVFNVDVISKKSNVTEENVKDKP